MSDNLFDVECPRCHREVLGSHGTPVYKKCSFCDELILYNVVSSAESRIAELETKNKDLEKENNLLRLRLQQIKKGRSKNDEQNQQDLDKEPMYIEQRNETYYIVRQYYPAGDKTYERDIEIAFLNRKNNGKIMMGLSEYDDLDSAELREIADLMDELERERNE